MVSPLSLETQFSLYMLVSTVAALAVGFRVFLPDSSLRDTLVGFVHTDWRYLGVAWVITAGVNEAAHRFHAGRIYTDAVHAVEGSAVLWFQSVTTPSLTLLMSVLYLVGFPFLVLFTYFAVKAESPEEARRYALAYACLTLSALPFFLLFPVGITARYLPAVAPLLYDLHPVIRTGIAATDTLVKAFPSLHAGLSILAALYARKASRQYERVAWGLAVGITLSTLYLGIHWLSDIAGVLVLVAISYLVSRRIDPVVFDPFAAHSKRSSGSPSGNSRSRPEFRRR